MDKFLEFVGRIAVPWIVGFFILLAVFLLSWFILGEIWGPKIRHELKKRAKNIKKARKKRENAEEKLNKEKKKKAKKRLRRMKRRKKKHYILASLLFAGLREMYKPKIE